MFRIPKENKHQTAKSRWDEHEEELPMEGLGLLEQVNGVPDKASKFFVSHVFMTFGELKE